MAALRKCGLLKRSRTARKRFGEGLSQISPRIYFLLSYHPHFLNSRKPAQMKARRYDGDNSRPKKSYPMAVAAVLGPDCSGPSVCVCNCKECKKAFASEHEKLSFIP